MKFHFSELTLWLKNGKKRSVHFEPNKVNVITGGSNTGKTAILQIIDYCFFSSSHRISESMINENVEWYGISFVINNKNYTIARRAPIMQKVSSEYYFSSIGEIPHLPSYNNTESALKKILEVEFGIDARVQMPFGGGNITSNSKVSIRYFLLFNTISGDIIESTDVFFDKQNIDRYREALPRIFDLAVGIDDLSNIVMRDRKDELEKTLRRLEKKEKRTAIKQEEFHAEMAEIIRKANEFALIEESTELDEGISILRDTVNREVQSLKSPKPEQNLKDDWSSKYDELTSQLYLANIKLRNAKRFTAEYAAYKKGLAETHDSLKPVLFLREKNKELVKTSIYEDIVSALEKDFLKIRDAIKPRTAIDTNISDLKSDLKRTVDHLEEQIMLLGERPKSFINDREKYLFLGEIKAKLSLYAGEESQINTVQDSSIDDLRREISLIEVRDVIEQKEFFIKMIEEIIQSYIELTQDALANYGSYQPVFNYREKKLQLRKPKSDAIENVGSSSNHMFLHLFFFLGLHETILRKKVPFIPSFLIMDQPSRPYYGGDGNKKELINTSDESKIRTAFLLLDTFISTINKELNRPFQMIVFEHVPKETWIGMKNVHLVEEFKDGNALIPLAFLN